MGISISSILRSSLVVLVFKVLGAVLLFLVHLLLGRELGPEVYGVVGVATAVAAALSLFVLYGFDNGSVRFVSQYKAVGDYARVMGFIKWVALQTAIGCGIVMVIAAVVTMEIASPDHRNIAWASLALLASYVAIPLIAKIIRSLGGMAGSLWPEQLLFPAISLCVFILAPQKGLFEAILALAIGRYAAVLASLLIVWRQSRLVCGRDTRAIYDVAHWYRVMTPLFLAALANILYQKADAIMLGVLSTLDQAGLYTAASRVALILGFSLSVVEIVVAPKLSAAFHRGDHARFRSLFRIGATLSAASASILVLILIVYAREVVLLFGADFEEARWSLIILAIGQFVNAVTGPVTFALIVSGHQAIYSKLVVIGGMLNVALNALLITKYGAVGAAIATAASLGFVNFGLLYFLWSRVLSKKQANLGQSKTKGGEDAPVPFPG